jgi:enoyl-CoA hydratase/carnithine racemase
VVGNQKAKWMLLTSARVKGKEAHEIGLADFFVPQDELMSKAEELAKEINAAGPLGVQAIRETIKGDSVEKIEEIVKWELSEQNRLRETADFQEGIKASLERRDPKFTGN